VRTPRRRRRREWRQQWGQPKRILLRDAVNEDQGMKDFLHRKAFPFLVNYTCDLLGLESKELLMVFARRK